jgi:pentatricopeptide repeat protein
LARAFCNQGKPDEALAVLDRAITEGYANEAVVTDAAICAASLGKDREALKYFSIKAPSGLKEDGGKDAPRFMFEVILAARLGDQAQLKKLIDASDFALFDLDRTPHPDMIDSWNYVCSTPLAKSPESSFFFDPFQV